MRFEPTQLLNVTEVQYCDFCSQADLLNGVHSDQPCILDHLNLIGDSTCHVKCLNFGFYQCFLKNCNVQVRESEDFVLHLEGHGILMQETEAKSPAATSLGASCSNEISDHSSTKRKKNSSLEYRSTRKDGFSIHEVQKKSVLHNHRCTNCNYSTTQRRYLDAHQQKCMASKIQKSLTPDKVSKKVTAPAPPYLGQQVAVKLEQTEINSPSIGPRIDFKKPQSLVLKRKKPQIILSSNRSSSGEGLISSIRKIKVLARKSDVSEKSSKFDLPKLQCSFCSYKAKLSIMVKHHERRCKSGLKKNFKCEPCSNIFLTKEEYELHSSKCSLGLTKKRPFNQKMMACKNCSYVTRSKLRLATHNSICGMSSVRSYRCQICHYLTNSLSNFNRHRSICRCPEKPAPDTFSNEKVANFGNIEERRPENALFSCHKCFYVAPNKASLAVHNTLCSKGTLINSRRCKSCHFIAKTSLGYSNHLLTCKAKATSNFQKNRRKLKTVICPKCSGSMSYEVFRGYHRLRCGNPLFDAFKCHQKGCTFTGTSYFSMKIHYAGSHKEITDDVLNIIKPKPSLKLSNGFSCPLCPFVARLREKLNQHLIYCQRRKNGCKEVAACQYPNCYFLAKNENGMITHRRTIHGKDKISPPKAVRAPVKKDVAVQKRHSTSESSCDRCPYFDRSRKMVSSHKSLCALRQNGESGIISCKYPGCYFLSVSAQGYNHHCSKKHGLKVDSNISLRDIHSAVTKNTQTEKNKIFVAGETQNPNQDNCDNSVGLTVTLNDRWTAEIANQLDDQPSTTKPMPQSLLKDSTDENNESSLAHTSEQTTSDSDMQMDSDQLPQKSEQNISDLQFGDDLAGEDLEEMSFCFDSGYVI